MATCNVTKNAKLLSNSAVTVLKVIAATVCAISLAGGLANHWHLIMKSLAFGFWINAGCAALATGIGMVILYHTFKYFIPDGRCWVTLNEVRCIVVALVAASIAMLFAYAQPNDVHTVTRTLASHALWGSALFTWLYAAIAIPLTYYFNKPCSN